MATYQDDEQIVAPQNVSGKKIETFELAKIKLTIEKRDEAPLEETKMKVLLELTGSADIKDRSPIDLVAVVDISGSMFGDKIKNLKIALKFIVQKLSPIDRFSIVTFDATAHRLFRLRQINVHSLQEIKEVIEGIQAGGENDMAKGLGEGLKVLNDRRFQDGRVGAIMVMSDGIDDTVKLGEHFQFTLDNLAVHTFGFGKDARPQELQEIAKRSKGGTFSDVRDENDLSKAFSQCLGGLLTVVVQDLNLTIKPFDGESTIEKVCSGNYEPSDNKDGSKTIAFGALYNKEVRNVLVDVVLDPVKTEDVTNVLKVTYTYSNGNGRPPFKRPPVVSKVTRTRTAAQNDEPAKVIVEDNRVKTVKSVKDARLMADGGDVDGAKDVVIDAKNSLDDVTVNDDPHKVIETMKKELEYLREAMTTKEKYEREGKAYAMSFETSHDSQRYASRGPNFDELRSFATPRMKTYLEQAKKFEEDPSKPPPSLEEDLKEELIADPLGPIAGDLSYFLTTAIQALKSIEDIIKITTLT